MTGAAISVHRLASLNSSDLERITALEADSFSNPWAPAALAEMLQSNITRIYVARHPAEGVVGFCACWVIGDELHINTLAIARPHRRRGIATTLLRYLLEDTGTRRATLEVRRSNTAALALYGKLGFQTVAVREGYYSSPEEDGLILWLNP